MKFFDFLRKSVEYSKGNFMHRELFKEVFSYVFGFIDLLIFCLLFQEHFNGALQSVYVHLFLYKRCYFKFLGKTVYSY